MSEESKEEVVPEQPQSEVPDLAAILSQFPGAPNQQEIEKLKQQYGEVFCSGFSNTELFIWRPLSRREYVNLQKDLRQQPAPGKEAPSEFDFEEQVVKTCTLWTSDEETLFKKGGSIGTLSEQIMMHSNFMNSAMAATLVVKL